MFTTNRLALGAHLAELGARWRETMACSGLPRSAMKNAQGWELPADGAHRAASSRRWTRASSTTLCGSKDSGLKRARSNG